MNLRLYHLSLTFLFWLRSLYHVNFATDCNGFFAIKYMTCHSDNAAIEQLTSLSFEQGQGTLLLILINFNPSMDNESHAK